jgi:hypothetical protein
LRRNRVCKDDEKRCNYYQFSTLHGLTRPTTWSLVKPRQLTNTKWPMAKFDPAAMGA